MRQKTLLVMPVALSIVSLLAGCETLKGGTEVERALKAANVVNETNLNDVMLTVADPNEAVAYFRSSLEDGPERIYFQRGLAGALIRAKRSRKALAVWKLVNTHPKATSEDRVDLADAHNRNGEWEEAEAALHAVPPPHDTYRRYRREATIADSNQNWQKADSFDETAAGHTTKPSSALNNWGYSKLTRGDFPDAERLFVDAIRLDPTLFTAKNNPMLARGVQSNHDLPIVQMSQLERAQLLHTLGLSAVKQGDVTTGRGLLREAIDTPPQHFKAAVRSLRALDANVTN